MMKSQSRVVMTLVAAVAATLFAGSIVSAAPSKSTFGCFCEPPPAPVVPIVPDMDMDQSVSFNDSDVGVVLYKVQETHSDISMDVYGLKNKGTTSTYLFTITQAQLAPYAKQHPAENTLLAEADGVSVYILTTGEIQINAGPDSEGKMHVKILDGIPWTKIYGYTIDAK